MIFSTSFKNFSTTKNCYIFCCRNLIDQILGHGRTQIRFTNNDINMRRKFGKVHRSLSGRISSSQNINFLISARGGFRICCAVVNSFPRKIFNSLRFQFTIIYARCYDNRFCSNFRIVFENNRFVFIFYFNLFNRLRRKDFRSESGCLRYRSAC